MWFKNLQLYRFTSSFDYTPEQLEESLEQFTFTPCGKLDPSKYGWVAPLGPGHDQLAHVASGHIMLCARKEEKVLPAAVIKEKLADKVAGIEAEQGRKVYRKEQDSLKEEIVHSCLPKAFSRSTLTYAYIAMDQGWLVVDASSSKKAEELTSFLRQTLGSLPVVPPQSSHSPAVIMTDWLKSNTLPEMIELNDECELREPGSDGSIIRCKRQDLMSEEILHHIEAGKQAVKVAVKWDTALSCMIAEDLSIKRLKFSEQLIGEAQDSYDGEAATQFDSDFALMTLTLGKFIPQLINYFGGPKEVQ